MDDKAAKSKAIWGEAGTYVDPLPGRKEDVEKAIGLYEEALRVDSRNVLAYHDLARISLFKLKDIAQAEEYCRRGYAVKDIPREITSAPWIDDIREEVHSDLDNLMMNIRLKQGRVDEARQYLDNIRRFFEKYSKGNYRFAQETFDKYSSSTAERESSGGPCFIATAVYGSGDVTEVSAFRTFRDTVLLPSPSGRQLIRIYYHVSPFIARRISRQPRLRRVMRTILDPLSRRLVQRL